MKQKMIITMIACIGFSYSAIAQKAAIKTNLLYDATTTFNLGVEFSLAPKWTLRSVGKLQSLVFSQTIRSGSIGSYNLKRDIWFCKQDDGSLPSAPMPWVDSTILG